MKSNFLSILIGFIGSTMVQVVDKSEAILPEDLETIVKIIVQIIIGIATIITLFRKRNYKQNTNS